MKKLLVIVIGFLLYSCSEGNNVNDIDENEITVKQLKAEIKEMDDSLSFLVEKAMNEDDFQISRLVYHETINRCLNFYSHFPEHDFTPEALEKVAAMYMALSIDQKAADWRDSLIINFPNYDNMLTILELQKTHYDNFETYEPEKIEEYIDLMLKNDNLSGKKREELEFRKKHIDKSFIELVKIQNPDLEL